MDKQTSLLIKKAEHFARNFLEKESSGHDWWHTKRVSQIALKLAQKEGANARICELAALLHDVGDHKLHGNNPEKGEAFLKKWINENLPEEIGLRIFQIISEVSYKGAEVETPTSNIESAVVQDADRLDAIGAIGIARTFAFGGSKGREMHNPEIKKEFHQDFHSYRNSQGPTVNHFYEKLLLLKDRMQTQSGKKMAEERHQFMEGFLVQFFKEWAGE